LNINDLTIGQAKELAAMFSTNASSLTTENSPFLEQHVLVRTYSAGVFVGILKSKNGTNVVLADARRIWKWAGAFTLSEVATAGISQSGSRMAVAVDLIELSQAIEIIATTAKARKTYEVVNE
jgi:hypothetical protein